MAWEAEDGVIDVFIWLRGAYRTLGLGRKGIGVAMAALKAECSAAVGGTTFRARYPTLVRARGRDRWQGVVWKHVFQTQGFHAKTRSARSDMIILEYDLQA